MILGAFTFKKLSTCQLKSKRRVVMIKFSVRLAMLLSVCSFICTASQAENLGYVKIEREKADQIWRDLFKKCEVPLPKQGVISVNLKTIVELEFDEQTQKFIESKSNVPELTTKYWFDGELFRKDTSERQLQNGKQIKSSVVAGNGKRIRMIPAIGDKNVVGEEADQDQPPPHLQIFAARSQFPDLASLAFHTSTIGTLIGRDGDLKSRYRNIFETPKECYVQYSKGDQAVVRVVRYLPPNGRIIEFEFTADEFSLPNRRVSTSPEGKEAGFYTDRTVQWKNYEVSNRSFHFPSLITCKTFENGTLVLHTEEHYTLTQTTIDFNQDFFAWESLGLLKGQSVSFHKPKGNQREIKTWHDRGFSAWKPRLLRTEVAPPHISKPTRAGSQSRKTLLVFLNLAVLAIIIVIVVRFRTHQKGEKK